MCLNDSCHSMDLYVESIQAASHALPTCPVHSKRARSETGRSLMFLAAIRWILMLSIRDTKPHPRPMGGLAGTSIRV